MIPLLIAAAAVIALQPNSAPITADAAQAMSPQALGDALLSSGHPRITEKLIGFGTGLFGFVRTDVPSTMDVTLFAEAGISAEHGFCEKTAITVTFAPVLLGKPTRAARMSTRTMYRWAGATLEPAKCEASYFTSYFQPTKGGKAQALTVVRMVAALQQAARAGNDIGFSPTVADPFPYQMRSHEKVAELSDGLEALKQFPVDGFTTIYLSPNDPTSSPGSAHGSGSFELRGGIWTVQGVIENGGITAIHIRREIPAPF